jgi:hypothetical protein
MRALRPQQPACIRSLALQPRCLPLVTQGGRDEVLLFLNSRCEGPPCARLRCNMFATQVRGRASSACLVAAVCVHAHALACLRVLQGGWCLPGSYALGRF